MRQKETQKVEFEEKKNTRKLNVGTVVCAGKVKENLNTRNNIHRVRPHLAKPAVCAKNRPKELSVSKEQQQRKSYTNVIQGGGQVTSQAGSGTELD